MAAVIMLHIFTHTITTSVARGRYLTGALYSDGAISLDDSRTSNYDVAVKRARDHGHNGFVHDTHTDTTTVPEPAL
jgi:hypothetical protein